jgi:hypothetical protein
MLAETIDAQYSAELDQWRQQRETGLVANGDWPHRDRLVLLAEWL